MGACTSSNSKSNNKVRSRGEGSKQKGNKNQKIQNVDLSSSHQAEEGDKEFDKRVDILKRGNKKELKNMIDNFNDDINEYTFGQNKTLLLEACIVCPNPDVIDMIMEKGADIDKEEYQTHNTAIFFSAVDLKVDFVKNLLKYHPNLQHINKAKQNIFEFLNYELFEKRKNLGRVMTEKEKKKYQAIEEMLREKEG